MRITALFCRAISILVAGLLVGGLSPAYSADLTDEEFAQKMEAYLENDQNLEKIGTALERFLVGQQARKEQERKKKKAKLLEEQFKNPVKVEVGSSPTKGPDDAKVTIVEFSDFQCPYCQRGANIVEAMLKDYPDNVRLVYKHLPLAFHAQAEPAARASVAASNQGKFWDMHDLLFKNQRNLNDETYFKFAGDLGLDVEKFKADYADPKTAEIVANDSAQAKKLGIRGTPGFFVNGVQLRGAQPKEAFKEIIDRWLKESG